MLGDLAVGIGLLAVLSFTAVGGWLYARLGGLGWWERALAFTAITLGLGFALRLPVSYWRGYLRERAWGFSTQSLYGWLIDERLTVRQMLKRLAAGPWRPRSGKQYWSSTVVYRILSELPEAFGTAIVMVTHDQNAIAHGTRSLRIVDGEIAG